MSEADYAACVKNLGLLEGEEIRLQYRCLRNVVENTTLWGPQEVVHSGLLVFSNDNMTFMQKEKNGDYTQAVRVPLESISGVVTGGTVIHHIRITVGVSGNLQIHKFVMSPFIPPEGGPELKGAEAAVRARTDILRSLTEAREEKKRLAQEAVSKGVQPSFVFCKFCGTRNKSDSVKCSSCGAPILNAY